jgi:Tfp pilus assembly protein PilV
MKTIKQKPRKGYALIEVIVVLMISLWSIIAIAPSKPLSTISIIDAQIFTMMMKSIHSNSPQPIYVRDQQINTFHPNHAFSKSFTFNIESFQVTFYIGRGYYAIKKRPQLD